MNEITIETTKDIASFTDLEIVEPKKETNRYISEEKRFDTIKDIVVWYYDLNWEDVSAAGRSPRNVTCRHMIMFFAKRYTKLSLKGIGGFFDSSKNREGGVDHSTVMHGIKKIEDYIQVEKKMKVDFEEIDRRILLNELFLNTQQVA